MKTLMSYDMKSVFFWTFSMDPLSKLCFTLLCLCIMHVMHCNVMKLLALSHEIPFYFVSFQSSPIHLVSANGNFSRLHLLLVLRLLLLR